MSPGSHQTWRTLTCMTYRTFSALKIHSLLWSEHLCRKEEDLFPQRLSSSCLWGFYVWMRKWWKIFLFLSTFCVSALNQIIFSRESSHENSEWTAACWLALFHIWLIDSCISSMFYRHKQRMESPILHAHRAWEQLELKVNVIPSVIHVAKSRDREFLSVLRTLFAFFWIWVL